MKNRRAILVHFTFPLLLTGLLFLTSCQTYRYGYWGTLPASDSLNYSQTKVIKDKMQELAMKKQQLTTESFALSGEILGDLNKSTPIQAHTFNLLFKNLQEQYKIDTIFHRVLQQTPDDSIREQSKQALLESALNYKNAFQRNKFMRRTINRGDLAYGIPGNTLYQTQQFLWSNKNNRKYLIQHEKNNHTTHTKAGFVLSKGVDSWNNIQYKTVYFLSMGFGRLIGSFHGHIDKKANSALLKSQLQEFDIVLLKSLTHLTEKFIPGYFGHVGVCLGNDLMIEAPRGGVRICTIEDFSAGEIFLVVRPQNLNETQKQKIRALLRNQVGKKYDYNFDTQSPDRVVCSELVCLAFDYVDWQSKKIAGRYTTSPDDLIRSMLARSDFSYEMYLNKGQFTSKPNISLISELLNKK